MKRSFAFLFFFGLVPLLALSGRAQLPADSPLELVLLAGNAQERAKAFQTINKQWNPRYIPALLEVARFSDVASRLSLYRLLGEKTGAKVDNDHHAWQQWLWNQPPVYDLKAYRHFKGRIYGGIDHRFTRYFAQASDPRIRLDEIVWGGVSQDGIPPLRDPEMIPVKEATYLNDDDVVFGLSVDGEARAYPKRILAWHEMFTDVVNGVPVAGVYCTLCGSMILYETVVDGNAHELGTSGFLYRSNKLMYDKATQSLWSTLSGEPVVGPLVGKGVRLPHRSVVTTTWGQWRKQHPDTTVLSLRTGHQRDYGEGVAYQDYFGTDRLMFTVPEVDTRLKNKAEVLALRFPKSGEGTLAIEADFLAIKPVHHDMLGDQRFVVLTDKAGANRVYEAPKGITFASWDQAAVAIDGQGVEWGVTEDKLTAPDGRKLVRLPAHRAFWFGWHAAFPKTRLVAKE